MSIQNGYNEIYEQKLQLKFKAINQSEPIVENWYLLKNKNINLSPRYDFVKTIYMDMQLECEDITSLASKFKATIKEMIKDSNGTLIEIINDTGAKLLTLEQQRGLLQEIGITSIPIISESLIDLSYNKK